MRDDRKAANKMLILGITKNRRKRFVLNLKQAQVLSNCAGLATTKEEPELFDALMF